MKNAPFLEKNMAAMVAGKSATAKWLASWLEESGTTVEEILARVKQNPMGVLDVEYAPGKFLFGSAPPPAFYRTWTYDDEKAAVGLTMLIGVNLGYGLNQILEKTPDTHRVVAVEPDPAMLLTCLSMTDYTPFFTAGKLFFLPPDEKIIDQTVRQADIQFLHGKILLRQDMPSTQLSPEYARLGTLTKHCLDAMAVELTTLKLRQDLMVGNELANYGAAMEHGSVQGLVGAAKGLPGLILGAGPSLADNVDAVREAAAGALTVTGLQNLPALKNLGLKPDLCMALDYSEGMLAIYDRLDMDWAKEIPFIYSTKCDPRLVDRYPGPKLPVWTHGGLATYVFKDRDFVLDAGGNVSVSLLRLLTAWGVEQVVLAGQDFAWKQDRTHLPGHHASVQAKDFTAASTQTRTNADGEEIVTTSTYAAAVHDMEKDIRDTGIRVANLYGGGMVIRGSEHVTAAELPELLNAGPEARASFQEVLTQAMQPLERPVFESRAASWRQSLKTAEKRITKLLKKPERNNQEIRKTFHSLHIFLRQDPLYLPYLYNEIMDAAGLVYHPAPYGPKDMAAFKELKSRVLGKVRRMDEVLGATEQRLPGTKQPGRERASGKGAGPLIPGLFAA